MAERKIYFGTREYMRWVKSPNSGVTMNRVGWTANGTYLDGGGWSRSSATTHFEPSMTWSFLNNAEVREIMDFYLGNFGQGPFYWLDPFSMGTNVLPPHWSSPRLAADDAPPLVKGRRPTLSDTAANSLGLPSQTATYELRASDAFDSLAIPVPDGFAAHICAWGSSTGTAELVMGAAPVTLTGASSFEPVWTVASTVSGFATLTARGEGFLRLAGLMVQVLPVSGTAVIPGLGTTSDLPTTPSLVVRSSLSSWAGPGSTAPRFMSGEGHSGCAFKGPPTRVGYSAPHALDYQSVTAEFSEVGAWL